MQKSFEPIEEENLPSDQNGIKSKAKEQSDKESKHEKDLNNQNEARSSKEEITVKKTKSENEQTIEKETKNQSEQISEKAQTPKEQEREKKRKSLKEKKEGEKESESLYEQENENNYKYGKEQKVDKHVKTDEEGFLPARYSPENQSGSHDISPDTSEAQSDSTRSITKPRRSRASRHPSAQLVSAKHRFPMVREKYY